MQQTRKTVVEDTLVEVLSERSASENSGISFAGLKTIKHKSQLLRLFWRGHQEEYMIVKWLRMAGIVVSEYADPETETQHTVSAVDGHLGGSLDGILDNVPEAPQTTHLGEFKTHSLNSFNQLAKKGMRMHKPEHFFQMQIYMYLKNLTRGIYYAVNKNNDEVYIERVRVDTKVGVSLIEKGHRVINSCIPLPPIDKYQSGYACTYCDYKAQCAGFEIAEVNCRTCSASEPIENGRWRCSRYNMLIDTTKEERVAGAPENDRVGCAAHTYIPALLNSRLKLIATDTDKHMYTNEYGEMIENGPNEMSSKAIKELLES